MAIFLSQQRQTTLSEYENYVYSVQPMPLDQVQSYDRIRRKMSNIIFSGAIIGLPLLTGLFNLSLTSKPNIFLWAAISASIAITISPFIYTLFQRTLLKAKLVPFGLNIQDISTDELTISEYRQLSTIQNSELLQTLQKFIAFRDGKLLLVDLKALKVDTYYDLTTPRQTDQQYLEQRELLVNQILKNSKQVAP